MSDSTAKPKKIIKNKLFPSNGDNTIWEKLMVDEEILYYISIPTDAENITRIIDKHCREIGVIPSESIITDTTACAGGNAISFAKTFKHVNAIEIDVKRYSFLTNNLDVYGIKNVNHYCDDCLNLIYKLNQDVIFFDPPWGGQNYKEKSKLRLSLSDVPLEEICKNLLSPITTHIPKLIAVKLPRNYDIKYLYETIKLEELNVNIFLYTLAKMLVVVIQKSQ